MKTTIQIKTTSGNVLYEHTCEDNSVTKTVEEAVKNNISLQGADLLASVLYGAKLRYADLRGADLREADLYNADLSGADLRSADLSGSNLCEAHLSGAYLSNVKADHITSMFFPQCPDGEFIGYKKAGGKIVKLLIPADAKRSSGTTLKCRCSKAKVLEIQEIDGSPSEVKEVRSKFDNDFIYRIGETVSVEDFDDDRWHECSTGIHFFISREAAVSY